MRRQSMHKGQDTFAPSHFVYYIIFFFVWPIPSFLQSVFAFSTEYSVQTLISSSTPIRQTTSHSNPTLPDTPWNQVLFPEGTNGIVPQ